MITQSSTYSKTSISQKKHNLRARDSTKIPFWEKAPSQPLSPWHMAILRMPLNALPQMQGLAEHDWPLLSWPWLLACNLTTRNLIVSKAGKMVQLSRTLLNAEFTYVFWLSLAFIHTIIDHPLSVIMFDSNAMYQAMNLHLHFRITLEISNIPERLPTIHQSNHPNHLCWRDCSQGHMCWKREAWIASAPLSSRVTANWSPQSFFTAMTSPYEPRPTRRIGWNPWRRLRGLMESNFLRCATPPID